MVGVRGEPLEQGEQFEAGQRDGQAKRSEEIDGAANQWQPAQVAIEPGGTMTFRIAVATHPVGSGQAPPEDKRFDASKCQPRTSQGRGLLHGDVPRRPAPIRSSARCYAQGMKGRVGRRLGADHYRRRWRRAGSNVALIATPKAAVPRSAGKPAIY